MTTKYIFRQISSVWTGEIFDANQNSETHKQNHEQDSDQNNTQQLTYYERAKTLFEFWKKKEKDEQLQQKQVTPPPKRTEEAKIKRTNLTAVQAPIRRASLSNR